MRALQKLGISFPIDLEITWETREEMMGLSLQLARGLIETANRIITSIFDLYIFIAKTIVPF